MVVNRDRMESRLQQWSNGSMILAVGVSAIVGTVIGAILF
jgi:hypothetical protein